MASDIATQHLFANQKLKLYDHDPGATTAIIVSPDGGTTLRVADMSLFSRFACGAMVTVPATGALTKLEIVAAEAATMASPVVVKDSGTIAADAVEDQAWLECTSEEIAHLGSVNDKALRYVAGRLTMSNAGGECVVFYELTGGRFAYKDLTPATTIA